MSEQSVNRPPSVFRGQPSWLGPALAVTLTAALLLYAWRLGASGLSTYYASAARSMADNWRAFAFGALDPGATWTLDKLSGFLVPQALAIKLFGFHPWVLDLPQVVEGLVTVMTSYVIGARWRGPAIGILVAGMVTLTPLLAAMFGHPTEDAMLTMTMVLAFAAWQRAVLTGRVRWLLLAGVWVAIGFQAKMMQAWLIVPALLIGFVIGTSGPLRARIGRAVLAGLATAALSVGWIAAIQLVPPADRPYIDGTTNNNAFSMVFAYNGVDRILPGVIPGGVPQLASHTAHTGAGTATGYSGHTPLKMLTPQLTTQFGWLYPAAGLGALLTLRRARRRASVSTDSRRDTTTVLTAVLWLGLTAGVLSVAFVPHASYFGVVALPIALLAAVGVSESLARFRVGRRGWWLLPLLLAIQTGWASSIALFASAGTRWLAVPILAIGIVAVLGLLVLARRRETSTRWLAAAPIATMVALLVGPAIWSSFVLGPGGAGSAADAYAGPRTTTTPHVVTNPRSALVAETNQRHLLQYVDHHGAGSIRFATDVLAIAVSVNLETGDEVVPMGGFSRQAPWLTSAALAAEVREGKIKFVLLSPPDRSAPANAVLALTRSWTTTHCRPVLDGTFRAGSRAIQTLYECASDSASRTVGQTSDRNTY